MSAPQAPLKYDANLIRTDAELRSLEEEWTRLYRESLPRNPFLSYEWVTACRAHVCPTDEVFVLTARAEGRLVGVAPLRRERVRGFRVLRFIGSGWSEYGGFLRAPGHPLVERTFLEELGRRRSEWDLLMLRQLSTEFSALPRTALPGPVRGEQFQAEGSPYLAFPGDWEALCAAGPSWLKHVQKRVRRFQRDGGTVERYSGAEAAERMGEVARVEAHSWQASYGHPVFQDAGVQALFRDAFRKLDPRGEMELWLARMEGQPVAYEINLLTPERVWLYRGGYHQQYARYGPGAVLEFHSIREAWREGRREYDYMSGLEPYKAERTHAVRPLSTLIAHPRTPQGYLAFALLVPARWRLERFPPARTALDFLSEVKRCPKAFLPGSGVVRSRVR